MREHNGTFIKLGRRSWFLLLYAIGYLGIANSVLVQVPLRPDLFLFEILPDGARFALWFIGSVVAAVAAFFSPKPSTFQIWGFVGLCIPVATRVVSYVFGLIQAIWDEQNRSLLISAGLSGLVIFGTMLATILLVAGWPEPGPETFLAGRNNGP